jgi:hypothetical protein
MALNHGNGALYTSLDVHNVTITRSIVAQTSGAGIAAGTGGQIANSCNDVWSNTPDYLDVTPGQDAFSIDPLFCDAEDRLPSAGGVALCREFARSLRVSGALDIACGGG